MSGGDVGGLFGSQTVEVGIGLTLFFLLVSLLCTAAREVIESILKSRATDLERGLQELVADPDGQGVLKHLFDHPMIFSLFGGAYRPPIQGGWRKGWANFLRGRSLPSYIPAKQFSTALIDLVVRGPTNPSPYTQAVGLAPATAPLTLETLRQAAAAFPNRSVQRAILTALVAGGGDFDMIKKHLEDWFDGTMDRAAGWYKRRTQWILLVMGSVMAMVLNLDALAVVNGLGKDSNLRNAAVAAAEARLKEPRPGEASGDSLSGEQARQQVSELSNELDNIGYPIGWRYGLPAAQQVLCRIPSKADGQAIVKDTEALALTDPRCRSARTIKRADKVRATYAVVPHPFLVLIGWLITALAVMLGAPFWFDVLNKFMTIRATVKPTQKSPDEPSLNAKQTTTTSAAAGGGGDDAPNPEARHLPEGAPQPPRPPGSTSNAGAVTVPDFTPNRWTLDPARPGADPEEGLL